MRKVDDPGTKAVMTTLMFAHDQKAQDSAEDSEEFREDGIVEEPRHDRQGRSKAEHVAGQNVEMKALTSV